MGPTRTTKARPHGRNPALARGLTRRGYRVAGRVWIEKGDETYLAWGRVVLLERIREEGSILGAAKSMGMGYRHAWKLVESMNSLAPRPLVVRAAGGRDGGGTQLTRQGQAAVREFWATVRAFEVWLSRVPRRKR